MGQESKYLLPRCLGLTTAAHVLSYKGQARLQNAAWCVRGALARERLELNSAARLLRLQYTSSDSGRITGE